MAQVIDYVVPKGQMFGGAGVATLTAYRKKPSASETDGLNQPLDLNNLPIDPAQAAGEASLFDQEGQDERGCALKTLKWYGQECDITLTQNEVVENETQSKNRAYIYFCHTFGRLHNARAKGSARGAGSNSASKNVARPNVTSKDKLNAGYGAIPEADYTAFPDKQD